MSYCSHCGTEILEDGLYCTNCGTEVNSTSSTEDTSSSDSALPVVPSGLVRRSCAHIVDGIVVFIIFWMVGSWIAAETGGQTEAGFDLEGTAALAVILATFALSIVYMSVAEAYWRGQTLGKKLLGIQVVSEDGSACSLGQALVRNVLRIVDGIAFYLIGLALALMSKDKQRLGDRMAGTIVTRIKPSPSNKHGKEKAKFRFSMGTSSGADYVD